MTIPVYGKVTYRGKAVSEGRIVFMPAAETAVGRPVVAHLEKDGSYRLASFRPGDGAVPGEYVVVVESYTGGPTPEEPRRPKQWFIPERYGDMTTSGLKASIPEKASRAMELNFALED